VVRLKVGKNAKIALLEIAWLLGSWAISLGLLGWLIGFNQLWAKQLEIQMHNTYFVLPPWAAAWPFFVFFATIVTSVRALLTRFQRRPMLLVLGVLGLLWALLVSWAVWVIKSIH
jgi:hypothetical protein